MQRRQQDMEHALAQKKLREEQLLEDVKEKEAALELMEDELAALKEYAEHRHEEAVGKASSVLAAMEAHLANQPFMLGRRPGAGDFGLFGQLSQLVGFDPTSREIAHAVAPRTVGWVDRMPDGSGLMPEDSDWVAIEDQPASLRGLLEEIGRVYTPAQLANAQAVMAKEKTSECEIDGARWHQRTFPYQAKCLQWTCDQYGGLSAADQARVDALIAGTGLEPMLEGVK